MNIGNSKQGIATDTAQLVVTTAARKNREPVIIFQGTKKYEEAEEEE